MERDEFAEYLARSYSCGCLEIRPDQIASIQNNQSENSIDSHDKFPSSPVNNSRQVDDDHSRTPLLAQNNVPKQSSPRKRRFKPKQSRNGPIRRSQSCRRSNETKPKQPGQAMKPLEATQSCENITKCDDEKDEECDENPCKIYRVRSFKSSSNGLINRGDSFKIKSPDLSVSVQTVEPSLESEKITLVGKKKKKGSSKVLMSVGLEHTPCYRVLVLGSQGVGKSSLIQQFRTSECIANQDTCGGGSDVTNVSVLLNEVESVLSLHEAQSNQRDWRKLSTHGCADAYLVVYSVSSQESFMEAISILHEIHKSPEWKQKVVILVANKHDMVRQRCVNTQEGKQMALRYDCKYTETSVVLNNGVDELLAGTLTQIRLRNKQEEKTHRKHTFLTRDCIQEVAKEVFGKFFRCNAQGICSCDNLMVH